jgi:hypothetical protein
MKLFLISQSTTKGYDTYDKAVVSVNSAEEATKIHPAAAHGYVWNEELGIFGYWAREANICDVFRKCSDSWAQSPSEVTVVYLGETEHAAGVICASFNAG